MADNPALRPPGRVGRSMSWSEYSLSDPHLSPQTHDVYIRSRFGKDLNWTLGEGAAPTQRLPLASFNHIAREVLNIEKSKAFYCDILGFEVGPRPPFDSSGYWLLGYGLSLHLVATTRPDSRKLLKKERIKHFTTCLPRVDHIAFITSDISAIKQTLEERKVYFKEDKPANCGIEQIFFLDPDYNVIEVSTCGRAEQNCALAVAAALSRSSSHISLADPVSAAASAAISRSPSSIYINGENVILSPAPPGHSLPLLSPSTSGPNMTSPLPPPPPLQDPAIDAALDAAVAAASSSMSSLWLQPRGEGGIDHLVESAAAAAAGEGEGEFYFFDQSYDFEEEDGAAVVCSVEETEGQEDQT